MNNSTHKFQLTDCVFVARPTNSNRSDRPPTYSLYKNLSPKEILIGRAGVKYSFSNWTAPVPESHIFSTEEQMVSFLKTQIIDAKK